MDLLIWILYGAGAYILIAAGYRVIISLKALKVQVDQTTTKLDGFGADEVEITQARASTQADLPKLLRDQRTRVRAKAQAKEQRRLRLISRISSINIDKRSA
jgi:hypothetical protein